VFFGVPRVWEKIAEKLKAFGAKNKGAKLMIASWAKSKGFAHEAACQVGGNGHYPTMYGIADNLILKLIKRKLGLDCCRFAATGAAPISRETLEYFGSLGITIMEVYGMSECTGATTISSVSTHLWGSCGYTPEGVEVAILPSGSMGSQRQPYAADIFNPTEEEQGEVCFRGRHVMTGYMANPNLGSDHVEDIKKKNRETIDDYGWVHSGDKGCMDKNGMLRITGRYKELIIGAGGENVAPVPIEDNIKKLCPAISNVMMVGDMKKYNVALVTLKCQGATGELPGNNILTAEAALVNPQVTTTDEAIKDSKWKEVIEKVISATNADPGVVPSNASKIQKFRILPHDFSVETGEFTPTLKLKRVFTASKWEKTIDEMYD